jgi:hypothetical protein
MKIATLGDVHLLQAVRAALGKHVDSGHILHVFAADAAVVFSYGYLCLHFGLSELSHPMLSASSYADSFITCS